MAVLDPSKPIRRDGGRRAGGAGRGGFTLVEILVVMVIIGIIVAFILTASWAAERSARERATQSLIAKLDQALTDRVDAILQAQVGEYSLVDLDVAKIYSDPPIGGATPAEIERAFSERAYVLAQVELFAREMPDVFFLQDPSTYSYPLNFAANPYPIDDNIPNVVASAAPTPVQYILPIGMGWPYNSSAGSNYINPGKGIYGASYHAAAGLYKNLGYQATGYDGVDNDGDGLIDNWAEGVNQAPAFTSPEASVLATVQGNLGRHQHKTARAEVLYALLVESQGPFGSIFNRDDFTDDEVRDTDGDGMPEFVDAWGEPLQFYRWPLFFPSDLQRGLKTVSMGSSVVLAAPYSGMIDQREQDPLDPNQQLMAPAWWSAGFNDAYNIPTPASPPFPAGFPGNTTAQSSPGVAFFENYFHLLHEPLNYATDSSAPVGQFWDRGAGPMGGPYAFRRAYSSKFLIISSGPDKELGLFHYDDATLRADVTAATSASATRGAFPLQTFEAVAAPLAKADLMNVLGLTSSVGGALSADTANLQALGQDDIHNHNNPAGGPGGSTP